MTDLLVVDDDEDVREIFADILIGCGFRVETANSGTQGLSMVRNKRYAAVLTDIRMPDGDGIEMLNEIRTEFSVNPPIIMVTAFADFELPEALASGARELIAKPVRIQMIEDAIRSHIIPLGEKWTQSVAGSPTQPLNFANLEDALKAETLQLGHGGCFVAGESPFTTGATEEFIFADQNSGKTWQGVCKQRWVRESPAENLNAGYGLEFINLTGDLLKLMENKIAGDVPQAFIPLGSKSIK